MVRVPGSSDDLGFHRESPGNDEDIKIKVEYEMETSAVEGSPLTQETKDPQTVRILGGVLTS